MPRKNRSKFQSCGEGQTEGLDQHQHLQPALSQDCHQRCPVDHCQPGRNVRDLLHLDQHSSCDMLEEVDAEKVDEESDSQRSYVAGPLVGFFTL